MTIVYTEGNLLDIKSGIICHQVNHKGVAGSGLAKQIREKYPEFMTEYLRICKQPYKYIREYGTVAWYDINESFTVASIFGQEDYGYDADRVYTDYYALKFGLQTVMRRSAFEKLNVYIPHGIGCGLAHGDWSLVKGIIEQVFKYNECHTYVIKLQNQ